MRIKLYIPEERLAGLKALGITQSSRETLRWTTDHPASNYGLGVILRGKSGEILDGRTFALMVCIFGAWIETDSESTQRKVRNALATAAVGVDDHVKVI